MEIISLKKIMFLTLFLFICMTGCNRQSEEPNTFVQATKKSSEKLPIILRTNQNDRRAIWQKPELVLKKLGQTKDKVIADIGAGSGYFAFRILPNCKKVIAIDIDGDAIEYMDSIAVLLPDPYKGHFETRKSSVYNSKLLPNEVDIVLMVNTYLYLDNRVDYLKHLKSILPPDGQLLIIDYKKKIIPTGPDAAQRVSLSMTENEIQEAGFTIMDSDDQSLSYQYIILAKP